MFAPRLALADGELTARPTLYFLDSHFSADDFDLGANLELYGRTPEFGRGFSVEALISAEAYESWTNETPAGGVEPAPRFNDFDNSSFARLNWRPDGWDKIEGLSLTLLPFHSDRLYLGFEFPLVDQLGAPQGDVSTGLELRLTRKNWYVFAAAKHYEAFGDSEVSLLGGGGVDLFGALQIEVQGAHVPDEGMTVVTVPGFAVTTAETWEAAGRVRYHRGLPIGAPTDFARYASAPARFQELLAPETYDDALSFTVGAEVLVQSTSGLRPVGVTPFGGLADQSFSESGATAAVEARAKWRTTRADLRLQEQSATAALLDYGAYTSVSPSATTDNGLSATLTVDHHFQVTGLTPGILAELISPAAFAPNSGIWPAGVFPATWTELSSQGLVLLPHNQTPSTIWRVGGSLRWDIWHFSMLAEASWIHDPNREGFSELDHSAQLGVMVQGRF